MELNSLTKNNKRKIRVGRGIGSGKENSSRGHKGQKSRSGVAIKVLKADKCHYIEDCLKEV